MSLGIFVLVSASSSLAYPCTTFLAQHDGQSVVGKSYDWTENVGLVVTNPRGLSKTALTLSAVDTPATWVSKYASVTFNQYGVEFPNGGMNEKGLVVELMWLNSTEYPPADDRAVVNELQFIQYALDGYETVAEFAVAIAKLRVARAYADIHYLACDAMGDCAAFEYLKGKLVVTRSADMLAKTLANGTYQDSAAYLVGFQDFGGTAVIPTSNSSFDRFVRASSLARVTDGTTIPASAFQILDSVAQSSTQWSIVYVPKQGTVYFRTATMPKLKSVGLTSFALGCSESRKVLDIDTDATGDVASRFLDYTTELNKQLIERSTASIADSLPAGATTLLSAYPDTYKCVESGEAAGGSGTEVGDSDSAKEPAAANTEPSGCSCSLVGRNRVAGSAWLHLVLGVVGLGGRRRRGR
jgi:penicillin V acylase-like amidase (Ntn superfamily)